MAQASMIFRQRAKSTSLYTKLIRSFSTSDPSPPHPIPNRPLREDRRRRPPPPPKPQFKKPFQNDPHNQITQNHQNGPDFLERFKLGFQKIRQTDQFSVKGDKFSAKDDEFSEKSDKFSVKDDEFGVKSDKFGVKGDELSVKGDKFSVEGDEFSVKGDELSVKGNGFRVKGNEFGVEKGVKDVVEESEEVSVPADADEIFKKMKETGLIPNAVAMLDGLCKDGLVQEAMKLFGLMREKGSIPEVVIYTGVVEGFCKAHKFDDAIRVFGKMKSNGIEPNAFSYGVLVRGLCKGGRLEDGVEFCVEMLESGHSPNLATFVGLVDGFCRERGLEDAKSVIGMLKEKGLFYDEKAGREYLDKKGPFSPLVWEAIVGKKPSRKSSFFD